MDCKSCQSWSRGKDEYTDCQAVQAGFGRCVKAPMLASVIDFNFETDRYELMPESRDVRMCVMDGSSYRAELYTMPDFHCSEYREKEKKDKS